MRKEITLHLIPYLVIFTLLAIIHSWFDLRLLPFFLGGLVGTALPDIDHLIYIYILRPQELTSQRATSLLAQRKHQTAIDLLYRTRSERSRLVFHSCLFQILFVVFAFFVVTSSGSLFGGGLVLAFLVHLLVDQYTDLQEKGSLDKWFADTPFRLSHEKVTFYWVTLGIITLVLGLFLA